MNRFALILVAFIFIPSPIKAEEKIAYGFQDIPFGTSFEEVKATLQKKYEYGLTTVQARSDYIVINYLKLGNKEFDALLSFDKEMKFKSFSFTGQKKNANYLETQVYEDLDYLTDVFKNKYGNPVACRKPNILEISSRNGMACAWKHKDLFITTGISVYEFQYYATATVGFNQLIDKDIDNNKSEKTKGAADGAKAF